VVEFIKTLQILNPSGDQQGPGTATLAADDGPGTALLSVIGGVVGGAVLLLLAAVALSLARRRRGLLS
jgi:hypothetical protein